jgi:spore maturation protein A
MTTIVKGGKMLNYLWGLIIIVGVVVAAFSGNLGNLGSSALESSKEAVMLCVTMLGVMSLWTGLMNIAKDSGLISGLTKLLKPVLRFLFPDIPRDHIVNEYISSNIISNMLGLGWAATPLGLKAMKGLKELNHNKSIASCDMCTFLIVNISSLQLIPINIIAFRSQYGSVNPAGIVLTALIATTISTAAGVVFSVAARKATRKHINGS